MNQNQNPMALHRQRLPKPLPVAVLALGAFLKNSACLVVGDQVIWSASHGDLADPLACRALQQSATELMTLASDAGWRIAAVAHDLHPDFYSTRLAQQSADLLGVPALAVQHHHAHVALLLAEHGLSRPCSGLALDGYGFGSDASAWGGEWLRVGPQGWQRLGQLERLALPGGDRAALEPWRMAAAALHLLGRDAEIASRWASSVGESDCQMIASMLQRGLRCPLTSSAGRWFDAAAGALGLSLRQQHEAQAAIALQQAAQHWIDAQPQAAELLASSSIGHHLEADGTLSLRRLLPPLFAASTQPERIGWAAARFHLALAQALADWVCQSPPVAVPDDAPLLLLSGGCFHNALLRSSLQAQLAQRGWQTLTTPEPGDATLALGQAWVAAHRIAD